jgi:hypothetical protein
MRPVLEVIRIWKAGPHIVPGHGPAMIDFAGYYARTAKELIGPFESPTLARRAAFLATKRRLRPDNTPPPPFVMPTRIVEI